MPITIASTVLLIAACGARSPLEAIDVRIDDAGAPARDAGGIDRDAPDATPSDASSSSRCGPGEAPMAIGPDFGPTLDLRVDDAYVYAVTQPQVPGGTRTVYRAPKGAGDPLVFDRGGEIESIAIGGGEIVWTFRPAMSILGTLRARPIDGSAPLRTIADGLLSPRALAVNGDDVYVGTTGGTALVHARRAGGPSTTFAASRGTERIVTDASRVFFSDGQNGGRLASVAMDGTGGETISGTEPPRAS